MKSFVNLYRWVLARSKKSCLVIAASFTGLLLFLMGLMVVGAKDVHGYQVCLEQISGAAIGLFFVFLVVSPSFIMANYRRKQGALAFLSLPASSLQKYIVRFLLVTVVWAAALFAGFLVFDLLQYVIARIVVGSDAQTATFAYVFSSVKMTNIDGPASFWGAATFWLFMLWFQSLYALGGTFFRRFQWIVVSVILLTGLIVFLSWSTGSGARTVALWLQEHADHIENVYASVCGVLALFVCINYWLSFRFFRRTQLIQNKWFNV